MASHGRLPGRLPLRRLHRLFSGSKRAWSHGIDLFGRLYGADRFKMEAAAEAAFDEVRRLDELLSNYRPDSEWSQVNRRAARGRLRFRRNCSTCLPRAWGIAGERRRIRYHGGPADEGWGFYKGTGHLPHRAEIRGGPDEGRVPAYSAGRKQPDGAVRPPGGGNGPGGIGKGYAVDRMVDVLRQNGFRSR